MNLTYNLKFWYWLQFFEIEEHPPQWWLNFLETIPRKLILHELKQYADVYTSKWDKATAKVVFKSTGDLTFFVLKYS
jgi:hypothetical protein